MLENLRLHLQDHPELKRNYERRTGLAREHLDGKDCCLLEDLTGNYCGADRCCLDKDLKKTDKNKDGTTPYQPRKKIDQPVPND